MAINPDIRDQAYQFFIEEAPELLHVIEAGLLSLNQERSTAKIHSLMRAAHSLKGGAASVGLDVIATLAHRLETIFKALYNDTLETSTELENWLLQAYDCLRLPLIAQITTGSFDPEQALASAEPIFSQIELHYGDALTQSNSYIPSSADMGIDMISSIFEVDVAQGLERLATILDNPRDHEILSELQIQVEIFAGFAELLNLPDFGNIAQVVQQALTLHPDRALEIAQLALIDFERSRQSILRGNRTGGTEPSPALLEFTLADSSVDPSPLAAEASEQITPVDLPTPRETAKLNEDIKPIETPIANRIEFDIPSLENIFGQAFLSSQEPASDDLVANQIDQLEDKLEIEHAETNDLDAHDPDLSDVNFAASDLPEDSAFLEAELIEDQEPQIGELHLAQDFAFQPYEAAPPPEIRTAPIAPASLPFPEQKSATHTLNYRLTQPASTWRPDFTQPQQATAAPMTVRVDSDRLERMNNLVGELAINRSSLSLQNDQLQKVIRELKSRFARFQTLVNTLQAASDQSFAASERLSTTADTEELPPLGNHHSASRSYTVQSYTTSVEFDSLEMDNYSTFYSQLQQVFEDLVQLEESVDDITLFAQQSNQTLGQHQHMLTQLRDELVWARMLPLGEVLNRFPRVLRDLSVTHQKPVDLKLTGAEVLIDRAILEKLYDPLLHLLRNAFDHGIEPVALRQQRGKPDQGQIEIRAFYKGNQTVIEVRDDGQGLNLDRIRQRILELGWLSAEQLLNTTPSQLFELIFQPGFSTAPQVSELSGRGIGLDIVRSQLQAIRGTVSVSSTVGEGTSFMLHLPLTLTITQLIICLVGSIPVALPADSVEDILTPQPNQIQQSDTDRYLYWRDQTIRVYSLDQLLSYACPLPEAVASRVLAAFTTPKDWSSPLILLRREQQVFALAVERIITEQELVIKPFGSAIAPPSYVYGCTILGDGSPVPVIDAAALLSMKLQAVESTAPANEGLALFQSPTAFYGYPPVNKITQLPTVLVVDDAVSLRRTLALFLERQGFRVLQAQDGREALEQLQQPSSKVQLVICDLEMPNMNGFEFLNYRRQDSQLAAIPVAILTSRSNEKHRWLAMQLGATDYFTKPYLEQEFLTALKALIQPDIEPLACE